MKILFTYYFFSNKSVGSWFEGSFTVDVSEPKPNRPNTMNLVEKRAQELGLCEDFVNGRARSLGSKIVKGVEDEFFFSSGLVQGWVLLLLLWYYTTRAFKCLPNCDPPLFVRSLWLYILLLPSSWSSICWLCRLLLEYLSHPALPSTYCELQ